MKRHILAVVHGKAAKIMLYHDGHFHSTENKIVSTTALENLASGCMKALTFCH